MNDREKADTPAGRILPTENPFIGKFHRLASIARKLFPDLAAAKTLIILVSGSIFAFFIAMDTGMFRAIDVWAMNSGLSKYPVGELVTLLIVLGVAIVTFIYLPSIRGNAGRLPR